MPASGLAMATFSAWTRRPSRAASAWASFACARSTASGRGPADAAARASLSQGVPQPPLDEPALRPSGHAASRATGSARIVCKKRSVRCALVSLLFGSGDRPQPLRLLLVVDRSLGLALVAAVAGDTLAQDANCGLARARLFDLSLCQRRARLQRRGSGRPAPEVRLVRAGRPSLPVRRRRARPWPGARPPRPRPPGSGRGPV